MKEGNVEMRLYTKYMHLFFIYKYFTHHFSCPSRHKIIDYGWALVNNTLHSVVTVLSASNTSYY